MTLPTYVSGALTLAATTAVNALATAATAPASIVTGNLLVAVTANARTQSASGSATYTWTPPAGWTSIGEATSETTNGWVTVWTKTATGTEPATYSFTGTYDSGVSTRHDDYVAVMQFTPGTLDGIGFAADGSSGAKVSSATTASVTPTISGLLDVIGFVAQDPLTITVPSGYTSRLSDSGASVNGAFAVADQSEPSAVAGTALATSNFTLSVTDYGIAFRFALAATGAPAVSGPAALSGVGSLTASGHLVGNTAGMAGAGALTVAAKPILATASALAGAGSLSASGTASASTTTSGKGGRLFDMRLVVYNPLGARVGPIPDLGFTVGTLNNGAPTLQAKVSTVIYGLLPSELEIAVEWWHTRTQVWQEGRDSRFAATLDEGDDRDLSGARTITAVGLGAFLLGKAALAGATPFTATNVRSEAAATTTTATSSGSTVTWTSHIIGSGDLVRVVSKGTATTIKTGGIYFARNVTTNTFQLSATPSGAILSLGTATLSLTRVLTRVVFNSGSHSFVKSDAVSVTGGASIGLNDSTIYYVVNPTAATVQLSDKPGGVPVELSTANTAFTNIYRNLDGQRVFTNATPGSMMDAAFLEARDRGWGVNGAVQMLHGWTVPTDSTGAAWTTLANDPTTPGVGFAFQPGTPGSQMLQALLDNQYAEWYTANGRTVHLVNYGTGNDHSADATPMRIGSSASAVNRTIDSSDRATAVTVRGVGNVIKTTVGSASGWGRLELYETAAGATTNTIASKIGATELAARQPEVAYTVTELAEQAQFLPLVDYSRGDWVACQVGGSTAWTRLRCLGWQFQRDGTGNVTVTVNLAAVKRTLLAKIAKKSGGSTAGIVAGSTGTPILESDNRKPAAPSSCTATSVPFFDTDGSADAMITVTWPAVGLDVGGGDVQVTEYEVWVRPEGALTGYAAGRVGGLTCDVGPYPCGKTFGISVRGKSTTGQWGEFSPETECVTTFPATIPAPPTVPTLQSSLGTARVSWDGLLIDPGAGTVAPLPGFAYVYAEVATSSGGPWTVVGQHLGHAGYTVVTGLVKGTTYFFRLTAVNTVGTAGTASTSASITIVGVTGPDMVANTLTANEIAVGAITAEELDLGTVPLSSPVDRIINPLSNTTFWASVIGAGGVSFPQGGSSGATATATGIQLATAGSFLYVMPRQQAPASMKIYVTGVATGTHAQFQVKTFTSAADLTGTLQTAQTLSPQPAGSLFTIPVGTYDYMVKVALSAGASTETVASCHVFEVTGTGVSNGEAAELSPSGLRLYDDTGHLAIDLTTATKQFLNVYDNSSGLGAIAVASIDQFGNAIFNDLEAASGGLGGTPLVDTADATDILVSTPNGNYWVTEAVLNRFGRGVLYDCTWNTLNGTVVTTQYLRVAQDNFTLEDGRSYIFVIQDGGLQISTANASGVNVYVELELNTVANTSPTSGTVVQRAVIHNTDRGYYALPPIVYTASASQATIDTTNRSLPAGVPLYWQVNTNLSTTPSASYAFAEFGNSRGLTVIDVGSSQLVKPGGNDALPNATDRTTSGASSGTTTGGTTGQTTTKTVTAAWSRSWHDDGATIVSGTGQYTDGASLYQGLGVTAMGAKFGFAALGISGKTVTAMQVYVHWSYWGFPSSTAGVLLGTHGDSAAPSTWTSARANAFTHSASAGVGTWINVPSSLWAGFAAGTYRGFTVGRDGTDGNYGYGQGVGHSDPPKLKVTYH